MGLTPTTTALPVTFRASNAFSASTILSSG